MLQVSMKLHWKLLRPENWKWQENLAMPNLMSLMASYGMSAESGAVKEWIAAKKSLCNAYRQSEDSPVSMERFYFGRSLCGAEQSMDECRRAIEAVTPKEVYQAAARMRLDTVFTLRASKEGEEESTDEED